MNLQQRAEFERQLAAYAEVARLTHTAVHTDPIFHAANTMRAKLHNARCDLIAWVEQNVEHPAGQPIHDTSGGN